MKDHLRQLLAEVPDPRRRRWLVREYLQARILQALQEEGCFSAWIFHGGTALRFLHRLPRHSEDLDFSLAPGGAAEGFRAGADAARRMLAAEGYGVSVSADERKPVRAAFLRFRGLYAELGLSPHPDETVAVKLGLDTRPPAGGSTGTTLSRRFVLLHLFHHDRSTLLAGKMKALLTRPYLKGRDLFDLAWLLADPSWPPPNLAFLGNALRQAGRPAEPFTEQGWRRALRDRLAAIDWRKARADVAPFLERAADAALLDRDAVLGLLGKG